MLEALRRNPTLQLGGNQTIALANVRPPAQSLTLSAEAALEPDGAPVAIVFGPENGAVSEKLVYEAAREAHLQAATSSCSSSASRSSRTRATLVDKVEQLVGIPATYVQATPDLVMGDLLKTMRSSQLFSVAGLPDVAIRKVEPEEKGGPQRYEVELLGLDMFDPTTFEAEHRGGDDVPAWLLDTAWNGLSFHVSQAFFPRTSAWDNLQARRSRREFEESVWDHLAGHDQRAVHRGRHARDRGQGDRRPRQRAARRQVARRGGMSAFEVEQPILNSPFEEPAEHWLIEEGQAPKRAAGRRRAGYFYRDPKAPRARAGQPARGEWQELELVNLIRERLAQWRDGRLSGRDADDARPAQHWRRDGREQRLFFAQLEAAETIIFLTEARSDLLQGIDVPPEVVPEGVEPFTRYACKMATGSGKTTVMGMLAAWSILNKVAARGDARFSDVVLVVCPNVTIRERLARARSRTAATRRSTARATSCRRT